MNKDHLIKKKKWEINLINLKIGMIFKDQIQPKKQNNNKKQYNIGEKTIKDLNQLSHRHLTSKQHIIIPVSKLSNNKEKAQYYVVKHGDTIGSIARAYKISEKSLKSINNLSSNHLRVGDKLYVEE